MKISYQNISVFLKSIVFAQLILALFMISQQGNAQVVVEMKLDTAEIVVGQQVQLTTSVSADAGKQVTFPSFNKEKEIVKGLEVVQYSKVDTAYLNDKKRVKLSRKYTITAFDSAFFSIPPMEVDVDGEKHVASAPVGLKVNTVPVDTTKLDQFAGPHTVVPQAFIWRNHLYLMGIVLWGLLMLIVIIAVRLTRKKPLTIKKEIIPQIPPYQQASTALQSLSVSANNDHESEKAFYMPLTDLLRVYLQRRFGILAMEMTTSEIISSMEDVVEAEFIKNLQYVFETADLVKFAKVMTSDIEKTKCLNIARDFLKDTMDESQEHPEPEIRIVVLSDGMQKRYRHMLWTLLTLLTVGGIVFMCYTCMTIFNTFF